jgi:hypothetical protein
VRREWTDRNVCPTGEGGMERRKWTDRNDGLVKSQHSYAVQIFSFFDYFLLDNLSGIW